jgi:hypothetical protein
MVTIDFFAPLPGGSNRPSPERALSVPQIQLPRTKIAIAGMHGQSAVTFKEMFFN